METNENKLYWLANGGWGNITKAQLIISNLCLPQSHFAHKHTTNKQIKKFDIHIYYQL
jgi:hypothetical protein